ncbi:hypothetical protein [Streptomyces sp. NPDC053431]|uniref:hypothetical protein n=1 Tax=Streptomyces sp. NPDC053431 TaxID=3365703 RepID=UPI0037CE5736
MRRDRVGRLVGAAFGLVFIQANVGALPAHVASPLRVLAVAAFVALVVFGRRPVAAGTATTAVTGAGSEPGSGAGSEPGTASFGRRYWYVVAAEVLGLAAGLVVIARVLHAPEASVGWIAFVVGVHFFGLAAAWRRPSLHLLGAGIAVCGAAGLALAAGGASTSVIRLTAGVLPGVLLLASAGWAGRPRAGAAPAVS